MRRLPRATAGLIIYMLVIFNIERITLQDTTFIDIKGFVYVLVALFIIAIIQFDQIRTQSNGILLFVATTLYFIGKFSVFYYYTTWNENTIYLIITELAVLWLGILLAKIVGDAIRDFEEAVEAITFSNLEKTQDLEEAMRGIQAEFYRSRRYNYPVTLVVVQPETNPLEYNPHIAIKEIQQSLLSRYSTVRLARELSKNLRLLDTIIDLKKNMRFAILYPQTEGNKADTLIQRINQVASDMGIAVTCGHASFPSDALTFQELLHTASDNMRYPTVASPLRPAPVLRTEPAEPIPLENEAENEAPGETQAEQES